MAAHLKRQSGVTEVVYLNGTLEVQSDSTRAFEIAPLLRALQNDIGFSPIRRIEASLLGRVVQIGQEVVFEIAGTGERLELDEATPPAGTERVLTGTIEVGAGGTLVMKPTLGR